MKVVSAQEMLRVEGLSYQEHGQEQALEFMENAGAALARFLHARLAADTKRPIVLLCGKGNNAGDAYVAGRHLLERGYAVCALQVLVLSEQSSLVRTNQERFLARGGIVVAPEDVPAYVFSKKAVLIDGLLGTGFHGTLSEGPLVDMIRRANESRCPILAVDLPSGLDATEGWVMGDSPIIDARWTLTLGLAKTGFFLHDSWNVLGKLHRASFGLEKKYVQQAQHDFQWISKKDIVNRLPQMQRNRHKYQRGSLAVFAGSPGMGGAALLSSSAALRAGSGIVRLLHSDAIALDVAQGPWELLKTAYGSKLGRSDRELVVAVASKCKALLVGPGLGQAKTMQKFLCDWLPSVEHPLVLDADGLNTLAVHKFDLPKHSVLTPHVGEMTRLLGLSTTPSRSLDFIQRCQKFAETKMCTIILKGAPTFVLHPGQSPHVCTKGDPGMATAGSGDVLAGVVGSLLAQGLSTHAAALVGTYIHGLAGEYAARAKTSHAMIASDIIKALPQAYACLEKRS